MANSDEKVTPEEDQLTIGAIRAVLREEVREVLDRVNLNIVEGFQDRISGLGVRLDAASARIAAETRGVINRPPGYHVAHEYHDIWGSGKRRTGHYG